MSPRLTRLTVAATTALLAASAPLLADGPFDGANVRLHGNAAQDELTPIEGALTERDGLRIRLDAITLPGDLAKVTADLALPAKSGDGYTYRWWSSNPEIITTEGKVTRPRSMIGDAQVLLKAFVRKGDIVVDRPFPITVLKETNSPVTQPRPALEPVQAAPEAARLIASRWATDFVPVTLPAQHLDFVVKVAPGESIQAAINQVKTHGGGVVALMPGVHPLTAPVTLCDRLTLVGAGRDYTVIRKAADFTGATLHNPPGALSDVVLKDFTFDGAGLAGNGLEISSGIDDPATQGGRILLQNVTIRDVFDHGMHVKRVSDLVLSNVRITNNGNHRELLHNLYVLGINKLLITDSDFSSPVGGKCLKLTRVVNGLVQRTRLADGLFNGVQIDDVARRIVFHECRLENLGKTALWFICERFGKLATRLTTDPHYAPQHVIINRCVITDNTRGAVFKDARDVTILDCTFRNRESDIITLRCANEVKLDDASKLSGPPAHFTTPEDVPTL